MFYIQLSMHVGLRIEYNEVYSIVKVKVHLKVLCEVNDNTKTYYNVKSNTNK